MFLWNYFSNYILESSTTDLFVHHPIVNKRLHDKNFRFKKATRIPLELVNIPLYPKKNVNTFLFKREMLQVKL